jgi:hypothetical protein
MTGSPDPSHPPSDPRPVVKRGGFISRAAQDRSVRVEFAVALLAGLVLFATGLYLWRRPHAPAESSAVDVAPPASSPASVASTPIASGGAAGSSPVALSDPRVLGCHDRGPKKTPADQCDHLASLEKALASAVEDAASCVPQSGSGGTIEYVADVSFSRHKVRVNLPRSGRSVRDRKVLVACGTAVERAMHALSLDGLGHQHARYSIAVTATYPGAPARGG